MEQLLDATAEVAVTAEERSAGAWEQSAGQLSSEVTEPGAEPNRLGRSHVRAVAAAHRVVGEEGAFNGGDEQRRNAAATCQLHRAFDCTVEAGHELGVPVIWGGDWRDFKDGPHIELDRRRYRP